MDDFLKELQEAVEKEERERLGFDKMTGDASSDSALIDCDSKADYFIKLIKKNQEEIDKINDYVNSELEKTRVTYENYRNEQIESRQKQIAYFQNMLESYAYDAIQGKKTKTIKLPHGKMSFKKQQPVITTTDETTEWLKKNRPDLINIETKYNINKKDFKKDGFINDSDVMFVEVDNVQVEVPGVSVTQRPDKFEIK